MVVSGDGRVEGHDAKTVELLHPVDGAEVVGTLVPQLRAEGAARVVVAHDPHDGGAEAIGERVDHRAQLGVRLTLAEVDEIAGEDDRIGVDAGSLDARERALEVVGTGDDVPDA